VFPLGAQSPAIRTGMAAYLFEQADRAARGQASAGLGDLRREMWIRTDRHRYAWQVMGPAEGHLQFARGAQPHRAAENEEAETRFITFANISAETRSTCRPRRPKREG